MNNVNLIGRVTKDIEIRQAGTTNVARFTLAVNRQFKKDESDFINCVAFGKTAEIMAQYVKKGHQVGINGRIQTGSYEKDGARVFTTDVIVDSFDFLTNKTENNGSASNKNTFNDEMTPVNNDDMPF